MKKKTVQRRKLEDRVGLNPWAILVLCCLILPTIIEMALYICWGVDNVYKNFPATVQVEDYNTRQ
ncbi:MAG: hypothetical protein Q7R98_01000 [Candidatus Jorgensenbacteria bacterium]|nr:hypothetical protein [Candidatus Jorgensenbacteria bacterium]